MFLTRMRCTHYKCSNCIVWFLSKSRASQIRIAELVVISAVPPLLSGLVNTIFEENLHCLDSPTLSVREKMKYFVLERKRHEHTISDETLQTKVQKCTAINISQTHYLIFREGRNGHTCVCEKCIRKFSLVGQSTLGTICCPRDGLL